MEEPAFSVIVAAFDSESRIRATLQSVLGQSRRDLELIVVDDGSSDDTAGVADRIAAADERVTVLRQDNRGTAAARNAGLRAASGSFVSFLDDDDLWRPQYLEAVAAAFATHPRAGITYSDAWVVDIETGLIRKRSALERFASPLRHLPAAPSPDAGERALLRVNFLTTCAVTIRAEALAAVGELDTSIRGADDWDLWLRIAGAGFGIVRVPGRLAVLRKRAGSAGSDEAMMARNAHAAVAAAIARGLSPRTERTARRHLLVLDREAGALEHGRRLSRLLWGALRRLGRKRILLGGDGWLASGEEPDDLAALLAPGDAQPDSRP